MNESSLMTVKEVAGYLRLKPLALEDGNFALIDGNLTCLNCMEGLQEK
jgi:hypothetical protein